MNELARLLKKLKSTSDANGSLLDQTMVLFGSGMGNSSNHSTRKLPILLAGGGFAQGPLGEITFAKDGCFGEPGCEDLNGDTFVDGLDLGILLGAWNPAVAAAGSVMWR